MPHPAAIGPTGPTGPTWAPAVQDGLGEPLRCRFCGAGPAIDMTAREHHGLVVVMQFLSLRGPFCRSCGLAHTRAMSVNTLGQGWWGPASFFITPVILLHNAGLLRSFATMPEPQHPAPGYRPCDPGVPLPRRPQIFLLLVPLVVPLFVLLLALVPTPS